MTDIDLAGVERIQVADIRPGDTVVVKLPAEIDPESFERMAEWFKGRFEGNEVLVVTAGVDISVMRPGGG